MAILGIIADDFTGATDIAGMLVKGGMRTIQTIGLPAQGVIRKPCWTTMTVTASSSCWETALSPGRPAPTSTTSGQP